jgi:hypothetical protein
MLCLFTALQPEAECIPTFLHLTHHRSGFGLTTEYVLAYTHRVWQDEEREKKFSPAISRGTPTFYVHRSAKTGRLALVPEQAARFPIDADHEVRFPGYSPRNQGRIRNL